jgi:cell division protein FtsL
LSFPWLLWASLSVIAPAVILLAVHKADVGLFRKRKEESEEWQRLLPERARRLYRILRGAPAVVVLAGLIALGVLLLSLDGAMSAVASLGSALSPHIPVIVGGLACVLAVAAFAVVWLNYRTRRLYAEYQFRREVLEKTGMIIVDKGSALLPPGAAGGPAALEQRRADGDFYVAGTLDVTPPAKISSGLPGDSGG